MEYRKLGKTGLDVGVIGLGTEYLVKVSRETVVSVVHHALDAGVNYFDILFEDGDYRDNFGAALTGLREKAIITAHLFVFNSVDACQTGFDDYLSRLKVDHVDILFVSCCDRPEVYQQAIGSGGHLELALKLHKEGKARYLGFSSHTVPVALQAVQSGLFDLLMFPVNPAFDVLPGGTGVENLQHIWESAGNVKPEQLTHGIIPERKELYHQCVQHGMGLVAMKPFAGGWLFAPRHGVSMNPVQLLHYALSQAGVTTVVPGAASMEQLQTDLRYLTASREEKDYAAHIVRSCWNLRETCMYCNHCAPCPEGIEIAEVTKLVDTAQRGIREEIKAKYALLEQKGSACRECGGCMERCPFGVDVIAKMKTAVELFEQT